ncbi:MAG: hypothetical protein ACI87V_002118 [Flavobacteriales bacterium]
MNITVLYKRPHLWGLFFALGFSAQVQSQSAAPFQTGESLSYELVYQWGLIWTNAGMANFTVRDTVVNNETYWHFVGHGKSYKKWDWFYAVDSKYESYSNYKLESLRFLRYGSEGSNIYDRDYHVKQDSIYYRIKDDAPESRYGVMEYRKNALDVVTAIYHCRALDFKNMTKGEKVPLNFYLDGAFYDSYLRFEGKVTWTDPRTNEEIDCILFRPSLIKGTIFKEGEHMEVYVTDDESRTPVYIETDLKVGKAKIYLLN